VLLRCRREKNRLAARKCRARKAAALQDLEQQVHDLLTQHQVSEGLGGRGRAAVQALAPVRTEAMQLQLAGHA
jgi:hypothetical protein